MVTYGAIDVGIDIDADVNPDVRVDVYMCICVFECRNLFRYRTYLHSNFVFRLVSKVK